MKKIIFVLMLFTSLNTQASPDWRYGAVRASDTMQVDIDYNSIHMEEGLIVFNTKIPVEKGLKTLFSDIVFNYEGYGVSCAENTVRWLSSAEENKAGQVKMKFQRKVSDVAALDMPKDTMLHQIKEKVCGEFKDKIKPLDSKLLPKGFTSTDWKFIGESASETYTLWLSTESIQKISGNVVTFLLKSEYKAPQSIEDGGIYSSILQLGSINCSLNTQATISYEFYDVSNKITKVVFLKPEEVSLEYIVKRSFGEVVKENVCVTAADENKRSSKPDNTDQFRSQGQTKEEASSEGLSIGSGFFITQDGNFATNYHVISGAKSIVIRDVQGNTFPASVVRADQSNDLVILKAKGKFNAIPIESSTNVKRGTAVVVVGFPHIDVQGLEPKVTEGIVSSLTGMQDDPKFFQISAAVQSGNSGGPLLSMNGNIIGIVTAKLGATEVFKATGDLTQNVNYAVKSNYLLELARSIPKVKSGLVPVNKKRLVDASDVYTLSEKSIGLVVVEQAEKKMAEPQESADLPLSEEYINQEGLIWAPIKTRSTSYLTANSHCDALTDLGYKDWRMPTSAELIALQASGLISTTPPNWSLFITWSSTLGEKGYHEIVGLGLGEGEVAQSLGESDMAYAVSCIHDPKWKADQKDLIQRWKAGDIQSLHMNIETIKSNSNTKSKFNVSHKEKLPKSEVDKIESMNTWWVSDNKLYVRFYNPHTKPITSAIFYLSKTSCQTAKNKLWLGFEFEKPLSYESSAIYVGELPFDYVKAFGSGTNCGVVDSAFSK